MYHILVCDDEKDIVTALGIYLKSDGYQVYEAYNGKEALDIIRKEEIHLVLMDIMMPEMDGIETLKNMQQDKTNCCHDVPVIMLTANAIAGARERYLAEGFTDFLSKPIFSDQLEQMIILQSLLIRWNCRRV